MLDFANKKVVFEFIPIEKFTHWKVNPSIESDYSKKIALCLSLMTVLDMDMWDKYDWYDFINMQDDDDDSQNFTLEELEKYVEDQWRNMSEEERYLRLSECNPTLEEFLLSSHGNVELQEGDRISIRNCEYTILDR